jgi:hypothetical protein
MSRFSDRERASILEQSRRILTDEQPPARPEPAAPREVQVEFEDDMDRWRREADEADQVRAAAKAAMRREEQADVRHQRQAPDVLVELAARVSTLEDRVDAIAEALAGLDTLANGTMTFSNAVTEKLEGLVTLTNKVDAAVTTLRFVHERECNALRDRLAASEAMHTRETVLLTKELADARREIDARAEIREHARTRMEVAGASERLENVVALVREDIAARKR